MIPPRQFSIFHSQSSILHSSPRKQKRGVGQNRLPFPHCEEKSAALALEGLAVGALIDRRICLVRADGDAVQRTVFGGRAVVCALIDRAVNGLVAAIVTHRE